jgi:hypothetical protein
MKGVPAEAWVPKGRLLKNIATASPPLNIGISHGYVPLLVELQ